MFLLQKYFLSDERAKKANIVSFEKVGKPFITSDPSKYHPLGTARDSIRVKDGLMFYMLEEVEIK